jgi:hypothetical protein
MGNQLLPGLAVGVVRSLLKINIRAGGEGFGIQRAVKLMGFPIGMDAHLLKVSPHCLPHLLLDISRQGLSLAARGFDSVFQVGSVLFWGGGTAVLGQPLDKPIAIGMLQVIYISGG